MATPTPIQPDLPSQSGRLFFNATQVSYVITPSPDLAGETDLNSTCWKFPDDTILYQNPHAEEGCPTKRDTIALQQVGPSVFFPFTHRWPLSVAIIRQVTRRRLRLEHCPYAPRSNNVDHLLHKLDTLRSRLYMKEHSHFELGFSTIIICTGAPTQVTLNQTKMLIFFTNRLKQNKQKRHIDYVTANPYQQYINSKSNSKGYPSFRLTGVDPHTMWCMTIGKLCSLQIDFVTGK